MDITLNYFSYIMEDNRKKQIISQAQNAYKVWLKHINSSSAYDNIEATVDTICTKLAFGTIIVSGNRNPSSYIGTYRQCKDLKYVFGGQVGVISNVWYWIGFANVDSISKIVKNKYYEQRNIDKHKYNDSSC